MKKNILIYICLLSLALCSCSPKIKKSVISSPPHTLRVMSYNIHHCNPPSRQTDGLIDVDAITAAILLQKPDLVALQEVDVNTLRSGKINQAVMLASKLNMNFYFAKAIDHDGGDYGVAILSRFPISEGRTFRLPKNDDPKAEQRVLATARVEIAKNVFIRFCSTHLDAQRGTENRIMQAKEINKLLQNESLPVILGGDLNATPDAESIKIFNSLFTPSCQNCDFTIPVINPVKTIDYIGYKFGDPFNIISHNAIMEHYASDHLPILTVLEYRPKQ